MRESGRERSREARTREGGGEKRGEAEQSHTPPSGARTEKSRAESREERSREEWQGLGEPSPSRHPRRPRLVIICMRDLCHFVIEA